MLIAAQAQIPIAQAWGGGLLASVDELRFVVPVRTINAGPSPKYFGYKRGITWLNAVNDQVAVAGIGQMVVPGIPRDSLALPGETIYASRRLVHGFSNPHDEPARYVAILTPSGYEDYFRAVAGHVARTGSMPAPVVTAELMAQHRTVLADPLPDLS